MTRRTNLRAASGLLPPDFQRNKDVFITRHIGAHIAFFIEQRLPDDGQFAEPHLFHASGISHRTPGVSPPLAGSSMITSTIAPLLFPAADRFVPAEPDAADRLCVVFQQLAGRILNIRRIRRVRSITRRSLNVPRQAQGANSCGFTFCFSSTPCARFADRTARRAPIYKRIVAADLRRHPFQHGVEVNAFEIHHHTFRVAEGKLLYISARDWIRPSRAYRSTTARRAPPPP